jgi:ribosomal peptide maturation radical SAM protein 1
MADLRTQSKEKKMKKIFLLNMPFANLSLPSIGLTQLKSVVDSTFKEEVSVEVVYFNQDFAHYVGGLMQHRRIIDSPNAHTSGLGDWFFRHSAFPEQPDNAEAYFQRYYPHRDDQTKDFLRLIEDKRLGLDDFFDSQIAKYGMGDAFVVGFTSMFSQTAACLAMAKRLKLHNPDIITVIGGANCESPMGKELAKNVEQIDFVFSGPALKSFPQFLRHLMDGEFDKCQQINGVLTKQNCGPRPPVVQIGQQCGTARDVGDELDINTKIELDYDAFLNTYAANFPRAKQPTLTFETSRGCWWGEKAHCTFCGLNGAGMTYRAMNPDMALEQFSTLFKYAHRTQRFECVDNILPKSYLKDVLPNIETPGDAIIFYEVKADLLEADMQVLAKARVKEIQPGIEALATSTLKLMKKGTTAFHNLDLLKNCISYNIKPAWNLLVGFPGEGKEVYEKYVRDLPLLTHLYPPSGVHPVRFDRYSPYFNKAAEYGLNLDPIEFYSYVYPFNKESLTNMAYYFMDMNTSAEYSTTMIRWIGKLRVIFDSWQTKWNVAEPAKRPQLYFKQEGDATVIYDSRFDQAVEHRPGENALAVLQSAVKPQSVVGFAKSLAHLPNLDVEKEIAWLRERGLLFEEGNRFMSLVLPRSQAESALAYA